MRFAKLFLATAILATTSHAGLFTAKMTTGYFKGFGTVDIYPEKDDAITFYHDGNSCRFGDYGQPSGCTRMGYFPKKTELRLINANRVTKSALYELKDINDIRISVREGIAFVLTLKDGSVTGAFPLRRSK